jgi:hypothetical protein
MILGNGLLRDFAEQWDVKGMLDFNLEDVLHSQIQEITGNHLGQVKLPADIMLEQLSNMVEKDELRKDITWTLASYHGSDSERLCIHLPTAVSELRRYKATMHDDFEVLDKDAYRKQFDNRPYVEAMNASVRFDDKPKKAVVIDIQKVIEAGLEISGFVGYGKIGGVLKEGKTEWTGGKKDI